MNKLPPALNGANQAAKLDPTWSKAYRRKASVLEAEGARQGKRSVRGSLGMALEDLNASPERGRKRQIKKLIEGGRHE